MAFNLSPAALKAFRDKFTLLLYNKVYPEDNIGGVQPPANFEPVVYALQRTEGDRVVLVRKQICFKTEWRYIRGVPAPIKANNWQMSGDRKRILQKAKEVKRKLVFEETAAPTKAPTKLTLDTKAPTKLTVDTKAPTQLTLAPKKKVRVENKSNWQTWSLRRHVLLKCFNAKRALYNQENMKTEETPRKRKHSKHAEGNLKKKKRSNKM